MASRPGFCSECGDKRTKRPDGVCLDCHRAENPPERRWGPCGVCGETTTSKYGTHPACRLAEPSADDADTGLPNGDWRFDPFRRVQIWVPAPPPPPPPPVPLGPGESRCQGCETPFKKDRPQQRYCTLRCRKRLDWARRTARVNQERREQRARARQEDAA